MADPATLFVVATPIGNLGDITLRALDTLKAVEHIFAEDTRRTRALLTHYGIARRQLTALSADASPKRLERALSILLEGNDAVLVTDAGTPCISDPGRALVRLAVEQGVHVVGLPGASAVTTAAAVSGLVDGPFHFAAFLPRRGDKRRVALARVVESEEAVIFFESPKRIGTTLGELAALAPERPACVARELTKLHEEVRRGTLAELAAVAGWRGEMTVVVARSEGGPQYDPEQLDERVRARLTAGDSPRTIAADLASQVGAPKRLVYERALRLRDEVDGEAG